MALFSLLAVAPIFVFPVITAADVVGYWRMETDNNPDPEKASIPNEIAGGSPLTSDEAQIHLNVPIDTVPGTGAANSGSLDPIYFGGVGTEGINATIAEYGELNVDSITVEFWCRTLERRGSLVTRKSGSTGFEIFEFEDVQVIYFVDDGTEVLLHPDPSNTIDLDETWVHLAWTYDAAGGVGRLYADGVLKAEHDGPDGRALVCGSEDMRVGTNMDGHKGSIVTDGLFDELRISDQALSPEDFLNALPEEVVIDIKPGSFPNSINPDSKGVIPVAILTTDDFDATTVVPETVGFGPGDALPVHWALEDVDGDGDIDMILHFKTQDTGISEGDTEATLTGGTIDGIPISGTDSVRTVPPEGKGKK